MACSFCITLKKRHSCEILFKQFCSCSLRYLDQLKPETKERKQEKYYSQYWKKKLVFFSTKSQQFNLFFFLQFSFDHRSLSTNVFFLLCCITPSIVILATQATNNNLKHLIYMYLKSSMISDDLIFTSKFQLIH